MFENNKNVHIMTHPIINNKVAILRDEKTNSEKFRDAVYDIATMLTYEATQDVPTKKVIVKTPLEETQQVITDEDKILIVPILRAGLGMLDGALKLLPLAKVGFLGLKRDESTLKPIEYMCRLPENIEDMYVLVVDPMLATGGSGIDAINVLKKKGCKKIKYLAIISCPEGVTNITNAHPDIELYVASLDRCLNDKGYILPGLGDAGDRIFNTVE